MLLFYSEFFVSRRRRHTTCALVTGVQTCALPISSDDDRVKASPLARRIAADKGIDLSAVEGTGPGGRIVKADVEGAKPGAAPAKKAEAAAPSAAPKIARASCTERGCQYV